MIRRVALAMALLGLAAPAFAHETTRSYATVTRDGADVAVDLRLAFRDIEVVAWMDADLDGRVTWGETRARLDAVEAYALSTFTLEAGGPCALTPTGAGASTDAGIAYLDLAFAGTCPDADAPLTARSRIFAEIDPDHRMFLQVAAPGGDLSRILSAAEPQAEIDDDAGGALATFLGYVRAGTEHLTTGADHLVFLLALMLPAVCAQTGGARRAALGVLAAVTGFTLAHALTLTAATTGLLRPPTVLVEILIALSIVLTAVDNVRAFIPAPRAAVAAFFGLIHGFGFASALGALNLAGGGLALALLGFNLGIEAAQVGVALVTMPALYMLGGGRRLLWIGSLAAGAVGLWWLWTRAAPFLPAA